MEPQIKKDKVFVKRRIKSISYHGDSEEYTDWRIEDIERLKINKSQILEKMDSIEPGYIFKSDDSGYSVGILFNSLKWLPKGVRFETGGYINLDSIKEIPEGTVFDGVSSISLLKLEELDDSSFEDVYSITIPEKCRWNLESDFLKLENVEKLYIEYKNQIERRKNIDLDEIFDQNKWKKIEDNRVKTFENWVVEKYKKI